MPPEVSIEIYPPQSQELSDQLIRTFSDHYRRVFNHRPYGQYLFYPSECQPISAEEALGLAEGEFASLEELDRFDPAVDFPRHPQTDEAAQWWTHPQRTFEKLRDKIRQQSTLVLAHRTPDKQLLGAALGVTCSLKQAFFAEEWHNPVQYSGLVPDDQLHDFDSFLKAVQKTTPVTADTTLFLWNAVFTVPEARRQGLFPLLSRHLLESLSHADHRLLAIGELNPGSTMEHYCRQLPFRQIQHPIDSIIGICRVEELLQHFCQ